MPGRRIVETGRNKAHTPFMNNKVRAAYDEWQSAVRQHQEQVRNARCGTQTHEMTGKSLFAVDAAYARYKQVQAEPNHEMGDLLDALLGEMSRRNIAVSTHA